MIKRNLCLNCKYNVCGCLTKPQAVARDEENNVIICSSHRINKNVIKNIINFVRRKK